MDVTDAGIVTLTTWLCNLKAPSDTSVREDGILTWRRPSAWIASFVAASTSFLQKIAVTSESACNSPADSSVWSSSTNNPSARTFTLRIWSSMGSSQCFIPRRIAFNSLMVIVGMTSTVRSPPSKVFTFSSHGIAAMAARKPSTKQRRSLRCLQNARLRLCQLTTNLACPKKLQHTPRAHPRQSPWPTMKGLPL